MFAHCKIKSLHTEYSIFAHCKFNQILRIEQCLIKWGCKTFLIELLGAAKIWDILSVFCCCWKPALPRPHLFSTQCHYRRRKCLPELSLWTITIITISLTETSVFKSCDHHHHQEVNLGWIATLTTTGPDMWDVHQKWRVVQVINLRIMMTMIIMITMRIMIIMIVTLRMKSIKLTIEVRNTSCVAPLCSRVRNQAKKKIGQKRRRGPASIGEKAIPGAN